MFDKLLNIGCAFDWITPTVAFIQDFIRGPVGDFGIPANSYWGRREIKRLFRHHGVDAWGLMYNFKGDTLMFTVRKQQADLAHDLLQMAGVPLLYAPPRTIETFFDLTTEEPYAYPNELVSQYTEDIDTGY